MAVVFDAELFFVFLSESIIRYPNLTKDFETYYESNKYRFYERARHNKYYNHYNMGDNRLESEVAMRRVFGILLCAEDDETIRKYVCSKLNNADRRLSELVKKPKKSNLYAFITEVKKRKVESYSELNAPIRFLGYLFYSAYGIDGDNEIVNEYLCLLHNDHFEMSQYNLENYIQKYQEFTADGVVIQRKVKTIIKKLKTGIDTCAFIDFCEKELLHVNDVSVNSELYGYIKDYCKAGKSEFLDVLKTIFHNRIAAGVMNVNGISLSGTFGNVSLTSEEQDLFIKIVKESYATLFKKGNRDQSSLEISISDYLPGFIIMLLAKEIRSMKEFYFRNNSETQYLELQRLESVVKEKDLEIERLKAELAKTNEHCERQASEIKRLTEEAFKDNKEFIKPYASEIAELSSKVRELEKDLESEKENHLELYALREFAFSIQSEFTPSETTVPLTDLIKNKRIIIVGGHINWRNKMKEKYPAIVFLDGHSVSFDNTVFDKADYILFYTSSMSHAVYYKVIDYLRNRKLKFDYLGRSLNPNLLEAEIISIINEKE